MKLFEKVSTPSGGNNASYNQRTNSHDLNNTN